MRQAQNSLKWWVKTGSWAEGSDARFLYDETSTERASVCDVEVNRASNNVSQHCVEDIPRWIWIFLEDRDEEGLNGIGLPHCCRHSHRSSAKRCILNSVVALIGSNAHPDQEDDVSDDADYSICHYACPEIEVLEDEHKGEEHGCVYEGIHDGICLILDEPFPLHLYQFEVQHIDEDEVGPNAKIIEDLDGLIAVEVAEDGVVKVGLVAHVYHAQVAGVVAEQSGD